MRLLVFYACGWHLCRHSSPNDSRKETASEVNEWCELSRNEPEHSSPYVLWRELCREKTWPGWLPGFFCLDRLVTFIADISPNRGMQCRRFRTRFFRVQGRWSSALLFYTWNAPLQHSQPLIKFVLSLFSFYYSHIVQNLSVIFHLDATYPCCCSPPWKWYSEQCVYCISVIFHICIYSYKLILKYNRSQIQLLQNA